MKSLSYGTHHHSMNTTMQPLPTQLDQLKAITTVAVDSGDFKSIQKYAPHDATTNPTLILKAVQDAEYKPILDQAIQDNRYAALNRYDLCKKISDDLLVKFGIEILRIVPGRVSTEVDARLSFDREGSIQRARSIIKLYEKAGIDRQRVLIKIASTWEGIRAAEYLQKESIDCNLTLLFSLTQAAACAEAGVYLISPFVGRISDYYRTTGKGFSSTEDPGVKCVSHIYSYLKKFEYVTRIMGASFRSVDQILALAGCDFLTISPELLEKLHRSYATVDCKLSKETVKKSLIEKMDLSEVSFRWSLNEEAVATDKLSDGIRRFAVDVEQLENMIAQILSLK